MSVEHWCSILAFIEDTIDDNHALRPDDDDHHRRYVTKRISASQAATGPIGVEALSRITLNDAIATLPSRNCTVTFCGIIACTLDIDG